MSNLIGRLDTHQKKRAYVNFYGNLMKLMDSYLVDVLDELEAQNLLDNTLVSAQPITARWGWRTAAFARSASTSMRRRCAFR